LTSHTSALNTAYESPYHLSQASIPVRRSP
jgi:hypothetical protein